MNSGSLWQQAFARLPDYLSQHVLLSVTALGLGLAISLPLALLSVRSRLLRGPMLAFASVVQTIPGLALLALFYPLLLALSAFTKSAVGFSVPALGFLPALMALTMYSMLPVLRNTITGLAGIDPTVMMAARGVGMTQWQSLWIVELPLATPIIIAGIRTAAVWVIGTATLSTPVGQTSLGNYIFTGLQTENWVFVFFGCVAAATLALVIDRLLALVQDGLVSRSHWRLRLAFTGLAAVIAASLFPMFALTDNTVVVGTKSFGEQYILGALIQDRLRDTGIASTRRDGLGSSVIFEALSANDVDVYVDYSGTIWTNEMHRTDIPGRKAVLDQTAAWLMRTHGIRMAGALGFENAYALAMRADKAKALRVNSIADLAAYAPQMKIGGDFEIFGRPEWHALIKAYGLKFRVQRQYQANFMYRALMSGDVDVITAFSSDGRIAQYGLKLLTDPKGALPPYDAILLVSPRYAHDTSFLSALRPLVGALNLKTMQQANLLVDRSIDKQSPFQVGLMLSNTIGR
ncbi:MAG: ABC transporter permease/substrate-binding protein [Alphaproteobacteria bacterium]|nr:ABC transporter permease/substrate-binding protein [Alphaproteobacteria bacterium]MDE2111466.1 ABC transporter permease/substrate-binding protein [Alphaproteobacteria bacterium]MDE2494269.1 ABC transporter permease/substrate-binding protein [Alphaproteobacteria bacterium]